MTYFPLFARLHDIPCLVVGGGHVAARKARQLRKAGATVTVNAPELGEEMTAMVAAGEASHVDGPFDAALVDRHQLIIAATADNAVNRQIAAAARAAQRFCNVVDDSELSAFIVPAVVDRSPVIIAVSSGGAAPVLATRLRQQIDTWLHPALGRLAGFMQRWRETVRTRIGPLHQRQHFWRSVLDGDIAAQVLAGNDTHADRRLEQHLQGHAAEVGVVWLTGAGPGDPELLTLKAVRALQNADVVLYDRLVTPAVLDLARRDAELIPVGKQGGAPSTPQEDINRLLVERASAGLRVCRLKGGDPFIFGRGGEELDALEAAGVRWEVIPGISAANGCAAAFGLPLTHRDVARSVVFATVQTGRGDTPDWAALAGTGHTLVLYMAMARLAEACTALQAAGLEADRPAALIADGTTAGQRLVQATLATLAARAAEAGLQAPAVAIIGPVAALARQRDDAGSGLPVTAQPWLHTGRTH